MDHACNHANLCIYDDNVLIKPMFVKVFREGANKYRAVAFFFY